MADAEKGIPIGKSHTLMHDGLCWVVIEHPRRGARTREDKRGNVTLVGDRKYFTYIDHALRSIYNSRLKGVASIADITALTESSVRDIKAVGREIREAIDAGLKKALD